MENKKNNKSNESNISSNNVINIDFDCEYPGCFSWISQFSINEYDPMKKQIYDLDFFSLIKNPLLEYLVISDVYEYSISNDDKLCIEIFFISKYDYNFTLSMQVSCIDKNVKGVIFKWYINSRNFVWGKEEKSKLGIENLDIMRLEIQNEIIPELIYKLLQIAK